MAKYSFKIEEYGYSVSEVDRYIHRLQEEYVNAIEWGNELENSVNTDELSNENKKLRHNVEALTSDCHLLAAKLKDIMDNRPDLSDEPIKNAEKKVASIIELAEKECQSIISDAELRTETIKKELDLLASEKSKLISELKSLRTAKENILEKIKQAKTILDV